MSLRPHMNVSLAVGLSRVPTSASTSLTLTKRAATKAMAFTAARFTAEHAIMERLKLGMNGGVAMRNGSNKSVACTFAAGMLAHTLMTVALGGAARLTAKTVRGVSGLPLRCPVAVYHVRRCPGRNARGRGGLCVKATGVPRSVHRAIATRLRNDPGLAHHTL
jgi:hypothetical protein